MFYDCGKFIWSSSDSLNNTINIVTESSDINNAFQPKAIRFYWFGQSVSQVSSDFPTFTNQDINRGVGFAVSDASRACVAAYSKNAAAVSACSSAWSNTSCVILLDSTPAIIGKLDINSINPDGFTLIVDQALSSGSYTIYWQAWGGADITNVTIGEIAEPAATGTISYAASGFTARDSTYSQCVMLTGVHTTNVSDSPQLTDSGLYAGFGTTIGANSIVCTGNSLRNSTVSNTDGAINNSYVIHLVSNNSVLARAWLIISSSPIDDVFYIRWFTRSQTDRRSIYMAIKGGKWQNGIVSINGNILNSTVKITTPFNVHGANLFGRQSLVNDIILDEDKFSVGQVKLFTNNQSIKIFQDSIFAWDRNSLADTNIVSGDIFTPTGVNYALIYATSSGVLQNAYSVTNIGPNLLEITTAAGGSGISNETIGYLVFGDKQMPTSTVGHPFLL